MARCSRAGGGSCIAKTMTEKFAAVAEAQSQVIARHWTEADEKELALTAWNRAADFAFEHHAFGEAEDEYRQALVILRTLPESRQRDELELDILNRFAQVL